MKMKKRAAFALALVMVLLLATTVALAGDLNDPKPSTSDGGDPPDITVNAPNSAPSFARGIVLNIDTANDDGAWEFVSEDPATTAADENAKKRTFSKKEVSGEGEILEILLVYRGKNSTGVEISTERDVHLEPAENSGGNNIRIEYIEENGDKSYRDVTLNADGELRAKPIPYEGADDIYEVLIPSDYLVIDESYTPTPSESPTESPTSALEDEPTITNVEKFASDADKKAKDADDGDDVMFSVQLRKNGDNWEYRSLRVDNGEDDEQDTSGDSNMIKIAWVALIAVSLVALFVNVMLIIAKNNKGGRR